ncbi:hypothetical protein [Kribbella sp. NPDC004875]|uniref:hypothetical protein n=1 Tax=Kribbella sp. NPDC004875 TaxID=3364107 RepID=UPI0036BA54C6
MMKRLQLAVVSVSLAALVATGTASAATTGHAESGTAKAAAAAKAEGKPKPGRKAEFAAMAAKLGVSASRLEAAFVAAKRSLEGSANVTPRAFAAAVAAHLGLPASTVRSVVEPVLLEPRGTRGGKDHKAGPDGKYGHKDKGADAPFATNAMAAHLAATLGVSPAKALAALRALVAAPGGSDPKSKYFGRIAGSLGVSAAQLESALIKLKQSMVNG